jgi:hypothetical protein
MGLKEDIVSWRTSGAAQTRLGPQGLYVCTAKPFTCPPGVYTLDEPLAISASPFSWDARGVILMPGPNFDHEQFAVTIEPAWRVSIQGLVLMGFRKGLKIDSRNLGAGKIRFEDCEVHPQAGDLPTVGLDSQCRSSIVIAERCVFQNCRKAMIFRAGDSVVLRDSWVRESPYAKAGETVIDILSDNGRDGDSEATLFIDGGIFNPGVIWSVPDRAWVGTSGRASVIARNVRFGGEKGGMSAVNNNAVGSGSVKNAVIIRDSATYAWQQPAVRTPVTPNILQVGLDRGTGS